MNELPSVSKRSRRSREAIRELLHDYVTKENGEIVQVEEKREEHLDRPFYYKAVIPVPGSMRGLFVELVLDDDDPDYPVVRIVNAHEQRR